MLDVFFFQNLLRNLEMNCAAVIINLLPSYEDGAVPLPAKQTWKNGLQTNG